MSVGRKKTSYETCIGCKKYLRFVSGRRRTIETESEANMLTQLLGKPVNVNNVLCKKCRLLSKPKLVQNLQVKADIQTGGNAVGQSCSQLSAQSSQSSVSDPQYVLVEKVAPNVETVEMPFKRVVATHAYCFICSSSKSRLLVFPLEARIDAFVKTQIYIPKGNRCCTLHMIKNRLYDDDLQKLRVLSNASIIEISELALYLEQLSLRCDSKIHDKIGDFTLSNDCIKAFTGLNWEQIIQLQGMMTSTRDSDSRTVTQALVVFLFRFRTGNSNSLIASVLGLQHEQQVSNFCKSVINSFEKDILPANFGIEACSRIDLITNNTCPYANKLHNVDKQLVLICDGTYIRHEKSANNEYQRKSYSVHKKVPLCKPFTVCTTDGFVVDVLGPFYATKNDAEILRTVLNNPNGLSKLLKKGDIFVLDRGFRDVISELQEKGYQTLMPALKGNRPQLTAEESNKSRLVTKLRWVIEAVHGIIGKKFKLLHHQLDNKLLPSVSTYCKTACYLNNLFGKRLNADAGLCDEIVERMMFNASVENTLGLEANSAKWSRRRKLFQKLTSAELMDFPELTERDLKIFFTGSYQLSQSVSYLAEIMDEENNVNLSYLKESQDIIKFEIRSRHITRKSYRCYIQYKPDSVGCSGILRYTCECANGLRTIGCCSHVAAIIYYLSHARYLSHIIRPSEILTKLFDVEEFDPVINEDSDDD